ncbi:MAG: trigger factor [Methylococcaceae bacterium]
MQISVEQTSELGRKMTVTLPESAVQAQMAPRLKKVASEARVDGFRRGKVPQSVVIKMYGLQIRDEIKSDLIQSSYAEALKEQGLTPAGYPSVEILSDTDGFSYAATFEVYPVVSLDGFDSLEVTQQIAIVEDSDVNGMIAKLKDQRKTWEVIERAAENNDRVTIDFSGVLDGKNFTNGKSIDHPVELGAGNMIPGFEDNLLGLKTGDTKTFTISFPEDYPNETLAGKPVEFEIEIKKVEVATLPEIDAEFITAYGIESGSVEAFYNDVKENLERELKKKLKTNLKKATLTALYEKLALSLPNSLVDEEVEEQLKPYKEMAKKNKMDFNSLNLPREPFEAEAKKRVALGLIIGEIIHQNELKVDEDKVRVHVEDMAKSYENPAQVIEWYYKDENRLNDIRQMTMEEQVTEWLLAKATVTTEAVDFNAVMNDATHS